MSVLNQVYLNNLIAQINSISDCQSLEALIENEIKSYYTQQLAKIRQQIADILPLISVPSDIGSVVSWITNYIKLVNAQYTNLLLIEAELIVDYTTILAAVTSKISKMNCTFTPPNPLS